MNKEEVLKLAIEKAQKGGWWHAFYSQGNMNELFENSDLWYSVIFSHDFAKCFWKRDEYDENVGHISCDVIHLEGAKCPWDYTWEDHLQKMVISEDPFQYLAQFLTDKKEGDTG